MKIRELLMLIVLAFAGCTRGGHESFEIVVSRDGNTLHNEVIPTEDLIACQSRVKEIVDKAISNRVGNRTAEISCSCTSDTSKELRVGDEYRIPVTATTSFDFGPYFLEFRDDGKVVIFAVDNDVAEPGVFANASAAADYLVETILDRLSDMRAFIKAK